MQNFLSTAETKFEVGSSFAPHPRINQVHPPGKLPSQFTQGKFNLISSQLVSPTRVTKLCRFRIMHATVHAAQLTPKWIQNSKIQMTICTRLRVRSEEIQAKPRDHRKMRCVQFEWKLAFPLFASPQLFPEKRASTRRKQWPRRRQSFPKQLTERKDEPTWEPSFPSRQRKMIAY